MMMMAIDKHLNGGRDTDKFRIKVWDKTLGDNIVYDNKIGAGSDAGPESDLDADPNTAIRKGSTVIHKGRK